MKLLRKRVVAGRAPLDVPFELNQGSLLAKGLVFWHPTIGNRGKISTGQPRGMIDFSNHGLDGIFTGNIALRPDWVTDFQFGNSLELNGTSEYYYISNNLHHVTGGVGAQFSMAAWIRPAAVMTNNAILAKLYFGGAGQRQYYFRIFTNSKPAFIWYGALNGASYRGWLGTTPIIDTGKWYRILTAYDGTQAAGSRVKIYVDGVDDGATVNQSLGNPVSIPQGNAYLGLGAYLNASAIALGGWFNGRIQDATMCDKVISPAEAWHDFDPATRWSLYKPLRARIIGKVTAGGTPMFRSSILKSKMIRGVA